MKKIILNFLIFTPLFLSSCDSVKRGLTGQKKVSSEEFLVQKKDPLVFPPRWNELPKPSGKANNEDEDEDEEKIIISLNQGEQDLEENVNSNNPGSIESLILKRIQNR